MNKFKATVKSKQMQDLIIAFFEDFNPKSKIDVRGQQAEIEVFFEEIPTNIIAQLKECEIVALSYGKEEENKQEQDEKKEKETEKKKDDVKKQKIKTLLLEEIAKNSTSFEDFAKQLAKKLGMDEKNQGFFVNLVISSGNVEKVGWRPLQKDLKERNIKYTLEDKAMASEYVEKYNLPITLYPLLKMTKDYKNYPFKKEESDISPKSESIGIMPNEFYQTLANVDKTQPIGKKVKCILNAMGLEAVDPEDQKDFINIAATAAKSEKIDLEKIFAECNITVDESANEQVKFATFIKNYVNKYDPQKKVRLVTFLKEIKEGIA